jgi:hypothetical protein
MTNARLLMLLMSASMLATLIGCSRTQVPLPASSPAPRNNSYIDLKVGWTLRIVVPLLKSGGFRPEFIPQKTAGNTISLQAADLIGYVTAHYAVNGKDGEVRLTFASAEESREGKTARLIAPPALPFELPRKPEHVRLVYLVRVSQADHNMAIVAARRLDALNTFTSRLLQDPSVCHSDNRIFCSWVPAGVAVRTETNEASASPRRGQ